MIKNEAKIKKTTDVQGTSIFLPKNKNKKWDDKICYENVIKI